MMKGNKNAMAVFGIVATLAVSNHAMAEGFEGFYVGGGAGYVNSAINYENGDDDNHSNLKIGLQGFEADAFLGYGMTFGSWYVGPEVGYFVSNSDSDTYSSSLTKGNRDYEVMSAKKGYRASGRVGYLFSEATMVYGRIGYARTEFETGWTEAVDGTAVSGDNSTTSTAYWKDGWLVGLGVEHQLSTSLFLLGEYQLSRGYGSVDFYERDDDHDYVKIEPEYNLFKLGMIYRF